MQRSTLCVTLLIYGKVWRTLPSFQWEEGRWGKRHRCGGGSEGELGKRLIAGMRGGKTRGRQQVHQVIGLKPTATAALQ